MPKIAKINIKSPLYPISKTVKFLFYINLNTTLLQYLISLIKVDDLEGWLHWHNQFFEFDNNPEQAKLRLVVIHQEENACIGTSVTWKGLLNRASVSFWIPFIIY